MNRENLNSIRVAVCLNFTAFVCILILKKHLVGIINKIKLEMSSPDFR